MKDYKKTKVVFVDNMDEMNHHLQLASKVTNFVEEDYHYNYDERCPVHSFSYIKDSLLKLSLVTCYGEEERQRPTEYVYYKDGTTREHEVAYECYNRMIKTDKAYKKIKKLVDMPDWIKENFDINERGCWDYGASPLLWYDETRDAREDYIYEYDMNSAYGWAMKQPQPDTNCDEEDIIYFQCVPKGYVGFTYGEHLERVTVGKYADIAFPLVESPFIKFADKWYNEKKTKTGDEKAKAKQILVYAVGFLQRTQPFLRANIVGLCNDYMATIADEDTIMINTDAIYSLKERTDLDIGGELGQFKVEFEGYFRHKGDNSQQLKDGKVIKTTIRGVSKAWVTEDTNILEDKKFVNKNIADYDKTAKILRRR